jgi:hypothetical protein
MARIPKVVSIENLGTVLPNSKTYQLDNKFHQTTLKRIAKTESMIKGKKKIVNGECCYYLNKREYQIIGRDGRIRVFEDRADGEYFVRFG